MVPVIGGYEVAGVVFSRKGPCCMQCEMMSTAGASFLVGDTMLTSVFCKLGKPQSSRRRKAGLATLVFRLWLYAAVRKDSLSMSAS